MMQSFQDVAVGFPAGGALACEDVSGTTWVIWATGELRVDPGSLGIFVVPTGPQLCPAKPIGCLLGADRVREQPGQVIARTSDAIHGFVRFDFTARQDLERFMVLASQAEAKTSSNKRRRITMASPQHGWANDTSATDALVDLIYDHCTGNALPLIYPGAELYGADPCGDGGCEVLLGRGAVVLSDPLENPGARIETYDLLFYDETLGQPTFRSPVGPNMKLSLQPPEPHPGRLSATPCRASMGTRLSLGSSGMTSFDFTVDGVNVSALTFDRDDVANSFVRDLTVRLRLTKASLKAFRGVNSLGKLREQIFDLKRHGLFPTIFRWAFRLIILVLCCMLLHGGNLYFTEEKPLAEVAEVVLSDTMERAEMLRDTAQNVGAAACEAFEGRGAALATGIEACAAMPYPPDAQACVIELARSNPSLPSASFQSIQEMSLRSLYGLTYSIE